MSHIPVRLGRSMRAAAGSILLVGVATMVGTAWPGIGQSTPENDPDQTDNVATWQPFTQKLVSDVYSFTAVDVDGQRLTLTQISEHGDELDRIVVTKPSRTP